MSTHSEPLTRDWSSIPKQIDKCAVTNVEIEGDEDECAVMVFSLSINTVAATLDSFNNNLDPITVGQNYSTYSIILSNIRQLIGYNN